MPFYAAHAPREPLTHETADRAVLVPQGFSRPAFFFGPWWLASQRLWRALIGWAVAEVVLIALALKFGAPLPALALTQLALALYLGAEGSALRSSALERAGLPLVDLVAASDEDVATKLFFERWALHDADTRPAAPLAAPASVPARGGRDVLGLFPAPGGRA